MAGIPAREIGAWTYGEIVAQINAYQERERREGQLLSVVAYRHASLVGRALFGNGQLPDVYEVFPFWADEEVKQMKIAKYKAIMERISASGGREGGEGNG